MSDAFPLSSAASAAGFSIFNRLNTTTSAFDVSSRSLPFPIVVSIPRLKKPTVTIRRIISCEVALKSSNSTVDHDETPSSSPPPQLEEDDEASRARIGARVRVKVPLKVYHVPRVPELDLTGMEGNLKQCVRCGRGPFLRQFTIRGGVCYRH